MTGRTPYAPRTRARRRPITSAQIAELADKMLTATSLRALAKELDLDKQTVFARARPIIAERRAAGTLGHCACGRERFHQRICSVNQTGNHKRWETPEQAEKRAAIVDAIMAGQTYAEIGRRWGIGQRVILGYAARHLTDEQRKLRKSLEQRRDRRSAMSEAFRPFRDEVYTKIAAAVPRWLSGATRDDAISDLYVAVLDGTVSLENIAADAKAYANRAIGQYESKFGPRSLDEKLFDDGDLTFGETLVDPAALDAFDYIFEEAQ